MADEHLVRLQVFMARAGVASRRKCEDLIKTGRVRVNGAIIREMGTKVDEREDRVAVDDRIIKSETRSIYLCLNKPPGYLCTSDDQFDRPIALDLVQPHFKERLYNVGRLDFNSGGLIFFTNDGEFTKQISHPSGGIEKEYLIELKKPIGPEMLDRFQRGITIHGITYTCSSYRLKGSKTVSIVLVEGKNREIRRVFEFFRIGIKKLTRTRIGPVELGSLGEGEFRELTDNEIQGLRKG